MPRIPRQDEPGRWHHVFNRAIARRTLFERREDYRFFLANLARAVHRREIEIHAYCLMGTHYHLLVRSPHAKLLERTAYSVRIAKLADRALQNQEGSARGGTVVVRR